MTDRRITAAMMAIPRDRFVPPHFASFAYSDETLTLAPNRAMLAPRLLAKLMQLAEVEAGDKALVVGGCCGYAAAIFAQLGAKVVACYLTVTLHQRQLGPSTPSAQTMLRRQRALLRQAGSRRLPMTSSWSREGLRPFLMPCRVNLATVAVW